MDNFIALYSKIENPTVEMVLFTFLAAFLGASLIALTYYYTTPTTLRTPNYVQALILSAVISTMILQSIGDNVASGLGILGALTIINFRTSFRDPRDIIFMFATLGVGIACGSYVFMIALIGSVLFCMVAVALKFTPFDLGNHLIWHIKISINNPETLLEAEAVMAQYCRKYNFEGFKNDKNKTLDACEYSYDIVLKADRQRKDFTDALEAAGIAVNRIYLQNTGELPID